ncbi:DNA replication and repair protein RecR [Tangfeifania diversioriginum]|uniref:Recombination protein RecR n=1 Tax=Tangfeifania diversioriginum TaxID=1168035 RepID=A0A1M6I2I3_9BACT|nr:recombination mediator RecR [Tangfeifania diversioriginum]SHJ28635.1 DNA replication and repair protein RecR [Tangfeifania diversioriginum]
MNIEKYPSRLLENAVNEFSKLPGIGRKSALRLVLHLLRRDKEEVTAFGESLIQLRSEIRHCKVCHNISDSDVCQICSSPSRNNSVICVVENIRDVMLFENTHQYNGLYHVLGGIISPMDGIGPNELEIGSLIERSESEDIVEIILALPTTMEGDTTNFYIFRKLKDKPVKVTTLARGVAVGDDLEYTDEITLGRSLTNRVLYESSVGK